MSPIKGWPDLGVAGHPLRHSLQNALRGTMKDTERYVMGVPATTTPSESREGVATATPKRPPLSPLSFVERRLRLEWVELGERVARAMGMRQEFLTATHRHWWAPCTECGEGTYVLTKDLDRACRMTPGCQGRHRKPQPQEKT